MSQTVPLLPGKLQSWELELWRERLMRWGMQLPGAHPKGTLGPGQEAPASSVLG